jgi:hypothetical protein
MRWLVTLVLFAGLPLSSISARGDWGGVAPQQQEQLAPTTPQIPAPKIETTPVPAVQQPVAPYQTPSAGNCPNGGCANKKNCVQKLKNWLFFCPTAGDSLPKLKVPPYTGPWTGTLLCTSGPNCACGPNSVGPCSGKQGCAGALTTPPAETRKPKEEVPLPPVVPVAPVSAGPYQFPQGYPGRGCQGGAVTPGFETPAESDLETPASSLSGRKTPQIDGVVSVEFRAVASPYNYKSGGSGNEFTAAAVFSRKVISPMDAMLRPVMQP